MTSADGFDESVMRFVVDHRADWATSFSRAVMHIGTTGRIVAVVMLAGLVVTIALRAWRVAGAVVVAVLIATTLNSALKDVFERARPPADIAIVQAVGYAMPSSEAARTSAAVAALLTAVMWRSTRTMVVAASVLGSAVLMVGVCMVYLGAHWPTDVLAGWVLGTLVGVGVGLGAKHLSRRGSDESAGGPPQPAMAR